MLENIRTNYFRTQNTSDQNVTAILIHVDNKVFVGSLLSLNKAQPINSMVEELFLLRKAEFVSYLSNWNGNNFIAIIVSAF